MNMNQLCVLIIKLTASWAKSEGVWPAEQGVVTKVIGPNTSWWCQIIMGNGHKLQLRRFRLGTRKRLVQVQAWERSSERGNLCPWGEYGVVVKTQWKSHGCSDLVFKIVLP